MYQTCLRCEFLQVKDQMGMLKYLYTDFKKDFIAGMTVEIAKGGSNCLVEMTNYIICVFFSCLREEGSLVP